MGDLRPLVEDSVLRSNSPASTILNSSTRGNDGAARDAVPAINLDAAALHPLAATVQHVMGVETAAYAGSVALAPSRHIVHRLKPVNPVRRTLREPRPECCTSREAKLCNLRVLCFFFCNSAAWSCFSLITRVRRPAAGHFEWQPTHQPHTPQIGRPRSAPGTPTHNLPAGNTRGGTPPLR